jgi:hypothetical protein
MMSATPDEQAERRGLPRYIGKGARGRRWLAEFAARQERRRQWVSFDEIADWCAREAGGIAPDPALRHAAYAALGASLRAGALECGGRPAVLLLCPGMAPLRVGRRWMAAVAALGDEAYVAAHHLALCWMPLELARAWLQRKRIAPPPGWSPIRPVTAAPAAESALERCAAWLGTRQASGLKREALWQEARTALPGLSTRDFDAAYRLTFRRQRGRPRKSPI